MAASLLGEAVMIEESRELIGVLVGWTADDLGERVVLNLQSVDRPGAAAQDEINSTRLLMTKNQATVLGNYLFQVAGQTPPRPRRRSLLVRLLGT